MSNAPKPQPPKAKMIVAGKVGVTTKPAPGPKALPNPVLSQDDVAQIALLMSGITHKKN